MTVLLRCEGAAPATPASPSRLVVRFPSVERPLSSGDCDGLGSLARANVRYQRGRFRPIMSKKSITRCSWTAFYERRLEDSKGSRHPAGLSNHPASAAVVGTAQRESRPSGFGSVFGCHIADSLI